LKVRSLHAGFSLVELLVVLAVIALLAALLTPVLAQARERGRQVTCLSHLRQTGIAMLAYLQDNDETFPNGINRLDASASSSPDTRIWPAQGWAGQCFAYLRSPKVLACPTDTTISPSNNDFVTSYGMNINLVEYAYADDPIPSGYRLSQLSATARTVLLFEVSGVTANVTTSREGLDIGLPGMHFSASGNGLDNRLYAQKDWATRVENQYATGYLGNRRPFDPQATQFASPNGRHGSGANYVFCDGHARFLPGSQVSSGRNASAAHCEQDNIPPQKPCEGTFQAAGTANPRFTGTFSIF
jgi:prepilin-type N-terminal cleavage/methylation domain-containing protein/prepilin-type processing-associated H-X9-DG protein